MYDILEGAGTRDMREQRGKRYVWHFTSTKNVRFPRSHKRKYDGTKENNPDGILHAKKYY